MQCLQKALTDLKNISEKVRAKFEDAMATAPAETPMSAAP